MRFTPEQFWKATPRKIIILWDEYRGLNGMSGEKEQPADEGIVYRNGKPYRKVDPKNAAWLRR
jgi:hypothetical protein